MLRSDCGVRVDGATQCISRRLMCIMCDGLGFERNLGGQLGEISGGWDGWPALCVLVVIYFGLQDNAPWQRRFAFGDAFGPVDLTVTCTNDALVSTT